ncbi:Gfo/Idh/MocA family oxidoreductase [Rheinheimera faecalis]|uniref:Gfo/Idh/MocA family oxidoreductase n=1 Tax=Rheinheimera faecalis TaxID=2901141 RepID=UPI001E65D548|nr:class I SAM-dependent methyltransferase [Rheinheimera faecalis]
MTLLIGEFKLKNKIAIIGAGQLGSRHLQGLAALNREVEIYLVDPSEASLNLSLERHKQVDTKNLQQVHLLKSIDFLPKQLDLVIIACTSDIRYEALASLSNHSQVENIILEKVLFQDLKHYADVFQIQNLNFDKVWVNFAQRLWPFFIDLKKQFFDDANLEINISGSNWGLGCNSVHNVDLADFLWSRPSKTYATLDREVLPSKRPQFVEFSGEVVTQIEGGGRITQVCYARGEAPFVITVTHPTLKRIWDVSNGILLSSSATTGWKFEQSELIPSYQSNLTTRVAESILTGRDCGLPKLKDACLTHVSTLEALLVSSKKNGNDFGTSCPVT